jgi:RNA polymerase sigma-70 factor, ECF subfamily
MSACDETILIKLLKDSNRAAFEQVVYNYGARIFNLHWGMTGDRDLAEDLTQETFIAVWRGMGGFRGQAKLATWIMQIARNLAIDHRRKKMLQTVPWEEAQTEAMQDSVFATAEQHWLRDRICEALAELPAEQREAVVLNKLAGCSHTEVARLLRKPLGTVKWLISQGIESLRLELQQKGVTQDDL